MLPLIQQGLRDPEFLSELQYTYTSPTELENKRGLLFINVKDKCFCVKPGPWIEERVWQKKREISFPLCHECGTKKEVYYAMRNRVSDICIPRLRSTTETLRWDRPWSGWNLDLSDFFLLFFFSNLLIFSFCSYISGDRLEKLDRVEDSTKDATENWNSIQETYRDAYPYKGHKINWLFSTN